MHECSVNMRSAFSQHCVTECSRAVYVASYIVPLCNSVTTIQYCVTGAVYVENNIVLYLVWQLWHGAQCTTVHCAKNIVCHLLTECEHCILYCAIVLSSGRVDDKTVEH